MDLTAQPKPRSFLRLFAILMVVALLALPSQTALAAGTTYYVRIGGNNTNDCLSYATACKTIAGAILKASADDTIQVYGSLFVSETVTLDKNVTIQGESSTNTILIGDTTQPLFIVNSGVTVTFKNIKLTQGGGANGGAVVSNGGIVTFNDVNFYLNAASGSGGVVYANGGSIAVINSAFNQNSAGVDGGAIALANGATGSVTGSTFANNTATGKGGAIYADGDSLSLTNSTFGGGSSLANTAADGGAVYQNDGTLTVNGGSFSYNNYNAATGSGGALYIRNGATLDSAVKIYENDAASGGGIYVEAGTVNIQGGSEVYNNGATNGAGVYVAAGATTVSGGSVVYNNTASGDGGGVYLASGGTVNVTGSTVRGNSAVNGAGVYAAGGTVNVTRATLSGNSASGSGGALYLNDAAATVLVSTLSGNSSGTSGAGIFKTGTGSLSISDSTLAFNSGANLYTNTGSPAASVQNTLFYQGDGTANCAGVAPSNGGHNLDSGTTCGFGSANSSKSSSNPLLEPLASNGGPTQTHAVPASSPAANAGASAEGTDQRGMTRPAGGNPEIGAFEVQQATLTLDSGSASYTEAGSPVLVSPGATYQDDNPDYSSATTLEVALTTAGEVGDLLSIQPAGAVTLVGSNVRYNGVTVGAVDGTKNGAYSQPLLITFNSSASRAAVEAVLRTIAFEHTGYFNGNDAVTARVATVTVSHGSPAADAKTRTVTITNPNQPPTVSGFSLGITEDAATGAALDFAAHATDPDGSLVNVIVSDPAHGKIATADTCAVEVSYGADLAIGTFYYCPDLNYQGVDAFTFRVKDNSGVISALPAATVTVNVTGVNDQPSVTGAATLTAIDEDAANPAGATVTQLFANQYSDVDNDPFGGVVITANAATTEGDWQYKIGAGSWTAVNEPINAPTVTLLLGAGDLLRFVPATNWNGAVPALTARVWDGTGSLTAGASFDATNYIDDAADPFSSATIALTSTVNAVNDAPHTIQLDGATTDTAVENDGNLTVGALTASEYDNTVGVNQNQTLTFTVKPGVGDASFFTVSGADLKTIKPLDFEEKSSYSVTIVATDSYTPAASAEQVMTITATDTDEELVVDSTATDVNGEEGLTKRITLSMGTRTAQEVTIPFTLSGAALYSGAGKDYDVKVDGVAVTLTGNAGNIVFPATQSSIEVQIASVEDTNDEPNEDVIVTFGTPTPAAGTDYINSLPVSQTYTILDDDEAPKVQFSSATSSHAEEGGATTITVGLVDPVSGDPISSGKEVTVPFTLTGTTENEAAGVQDYAFGVYDFGVPGHVDLTAGTLTGVITIPAGQQTATVRVTPVDDAYDEEDETLIVTLGTPSEATLGATSAHTLTLVDNEATPTISIADLTLAEGNSGLTSFNFTLTLTGASERVITGTYSTLDNTGEADPKRRASVGTDYNSVTDMDFTFPVRQTSTTITIPVIGDGSYELDESFLVELGDLSTDTVGAADIQATGVIQNDELKPKVSFSTSAVSRNESYGAVTVTAQQDSLSMLDTTIPFTVNGTATRNSDYTLTTTPVDTITIPAGQTQASVTINVTQDTVDEVDQTVRLTMGTPTNADKHGSNPTEYVLTILDDDNAPIITVNDPTAVTEGTGAGSTDLTFTVSLDRGSEKGVSVNYATLDGAAVSPADFTALSSTALNFSTSGLETSKTVTVSITRDDIDEVDEALSLTLSGPTNATIGDDTGAGTITDDDDPPAISIDDVTTTEGNSGTTDATFTVSLSNPNGSGKTITVDYATAAGTAGANDFTGVSGALTFAPGEITHTITVPVKGDLIYEGVTDEEFTVNLTNPSNATISDAQGKGVIDEDDSAPTLSVDDVTVTEGNSGTVDATFTVSLSAVSGLTTTVEVSTADGSAKTADGDYTALTSHLVTIPAGNASGTFVVTVNGDTRDEGASEDYSVALANPTNSTILDGSGQGVITDDDDPPTVSFAAGTSTAAEADGTKTITVNLSTASGLEITVPFTVTASTASDPADYGVTTTSPLIFAAGETSKTLTVSLVNDTLYETSETVTFGLTTGSLVNATAGATTSHELTITSEDAKPTVAFTAASQTVDEDQDPATVTATVRLSAISGLDTTVPFTLSGTAQGGGVDYTQTTTSPVTIAAGQQEATITLTLVDDVYDELDETAILTIGSPTNADKGATGAHEISITDNDPTPTLVVAGYSAAEGNSGTKTFTFNVTLSATSGLPVTVNYATSNGTATAGEDYTAASGTLTFSALTGTLTQTVNVTVNGDTKDEADETFSVTLSSPSNATVASATATGTITNDDNPPEVEVDSVAVNETDSGTATAAFTVHLSAISGKTVSVVVDTANGAATAGADYTALATSTLVTFAPGEQNKTVNVTVLADDLDEDDETYSVVLSGPTNATLKSGASTGTGTIVDDDDPPAVSISDRTVAEGNSGSTAMTFTVNLAAASGRPVVLTWDVTGGTAMANADFTIPALEADRTLTFAAGETSKTFDVTALGDTLDEGTQETLTVTLTPANVATVAAASDLEATGTITDDDEAGYTFTETAFGNVNEGVQKQFSVSLNSQPSENVVIDLSSSSSEATLDETTLTFTPGNYNTPQVVTVTAVDDDIYEDDLPVTITTTATTGDALFGSLNPPDVTLTVVNTDAMPEVSISAISPVGGVVTEGEMVELTVTLTRASRKPVQVGFTLTPGAGLENVSDYSAVPVGGSLLFSTVSLETQKIIRVSFVDDDLDEEDETLSVALSATTNVALASSNTSANLTVQDNDTAGFTLADQNAVAVLEAGPTSDTYTAVLTSQPLVDVSLTVAAQHGQVVVSSDGTTFNSSATLTFTPSNWSTPQTVTVKAVDDALDEEDTYTDTLTQTVAAVGDAKYNNFTLADVTVTVTDNDALPDVYFTQLSQSKAENASDKTMTAQVQLSAASGRTITIPFTVTGSAARGAGADYTLNATVDGSGNGALTIPAGSTEPATPLIVTYVNDDVAETDETVIITLGTPVNATLGSLKTHTATILNDDTAGVLVTPGTLAVSEADAAGTQQTFTVRLNSQPTQPVAVTIAADAQSVVSKDGTNFSSSVQLDFDNGALSWKTAQTVTVRAVNDTIDEASPHSAALTNTAASTDPAYNNIAVDDLTYSVTDDDTAQLSIAPLTVSGTEDQNLTFTVKLSNASTAPVTVDYATADGTALAGSDYTANTGTLTFPAFTTTLEQTVTVTVTDDSTDEPDQAFTFTLSNPANAAIESGKGTGTGTIQDNDNAPSFSISAVSGPEGTATDQTLDFVATLSAVSEKEVTVQYATSDDTATAGVDYTAASGTLTFAAGTTTLTQTVSVPLTKDTTEEPDETFNFTLSAPTNATLTAPATVTGTIQNDDGAPTVSVADVTVSPESGVATFTATLSEVSGKDASFTFTTTDGTATTADYTQVTSAQTVNIPKGQLTATFTVAITSDTLDEDNETFQVNLAGLTNLTEAGSDLSATATIEDDDASPTVSISGPGSFDEMDGTVTFTVTLSSVSGRAVTVDYATSGTGTYPATAGSDYTSTSGTLTFAAGDSVKTISVPVVEDSKDEYNETFQAQLSNLVNLAASGNTTSATGTINDDDAEPVITIADAATQDEGNTGGPTSFSFTVTLSNPSQKTVTVDYQTADGTAKTANSDYTAKSGSVTFGDNETSKPIVVSVTPDTFNEDDEVFYINLSNSVNASLAADKQGQATIRNDDAAPTVAFTIPNQSVAEDAGSVSIIAQLSAVSGKDVTLDLSSASSTATVTADYTPAVPATLTIPAGTINATLTFTVVDDALDENDETIVVDITSATHASPTGNTVHTATITDNDALPALSINDVTLTEGQTASFTVTLNPVSGRGVTVDYSTTADTAVTPADFAAASGSLTFAAGETTKTVSVSTVDDMLKEASETFRVDLSSASNATLSDANGQATIEDNDAANVVITPSALGDVTEGQTAQYTVALTSQPLVDVVVSIAASSSEVDLDKTSLTFTTANYATPQTVTVTAKADAFDEDNLAVTLDQSVSAVGDSDYNNFAVADVTLTVVDNNDAPTAAFTAATQSLAENAGAPLTLTVQLSAASRKTVKVDYAVMSGATATLDTDYTLLPTPGTLTFAAGETEKTITLTAVDDRYVEGSEALTLELTANQNVTLGATSQTAVTLTDDDTAGVTITPATLSVTEAAGASHTGAYSVVLTNRPQTNVVVDITTSATQATVDKTSLTFTPANWDQAQTVTVTAIDDTLFEFGDQSQTVTHAVHSGSDSHFTGLTLTSVAATIVDNEATPQIYFSDPAAARVESNATPVTVSIRLIPAANQAVTVNLGAAGSATVADDYTMTPAAGVVTIPAGQTSVAVSMTVVNDDIYEPDETAALKLTSPLSPVTLGSQDSFSLVIINEDELGFTMTNSGLTISETGPTSKTYTVRLKSKPTADVTITPAHTGGQVTLSQTSLVFTPSNWNTAQTVTVTAVDDNIDENGDHTAEVTHTVASSDANYNGAAMDSLTYTITDNDDAEFSAADAQAAENAGSMTFTVTLSKPSASALTVDYITSDGSATVGDDYTAASGTLTFQAGDTSKQVVVTILDDTADEGIETFTLTLSNASAGVSIADGAATGKIIDNEQPILTIEDASVTEGDSGNVNLNVKVSLSYDPGADVVATYQTQAGTATAGTDYQTTSGSVTIATGASPREATIQVPVVGDRLDEANETFTVTLLSVTTNNATIGAGADVATATITDDDASPVIDANWTEVTATEDTTTTFAAADFTGHYSDGDTDALSAIRFTVLTTQGALKLDGAAISANQEIAAADLSKLTYTPASNFNGADAFTWQATDGFNWSNTMTTPVNVAAVNDAPALTVPGAQTTGEESALTFSGAKLISFTDVDATSAQVSLSVTHGVLTLGATTDLSITTGDGDSDASVVFTGALSALNAALNGLVFTPALDFNGDATLTVVIDDLGNAGAGGAKQDTKTVTITVTAVNDLPTLDALSPVTVNEDAQGQSVSLAGISAGGGESQTLTVTATSDTPGVVPNPTVTYTSPDATGTLTFNTVENATGTATITVTVTDADNGTFSHTFVITVEPVNDAPMITMPGNQVMTQGSTLVFSSATNKAITVADVDSNGSNVEVKLSVGTGATLTLGSTVGVTATGDGTNEITITGTVTAINQAMNGLTFTPGGSDEFQPLTVTVNDKGNTGSGEAKTDNKSLIIFIQTENQAPTFTSKSPDTLSVDEDTTFSFSDANQFAIADADAGTNAVKVTIAVNKGRLTLGVRTGLAFSDAQDDDIMIFTGTLTNINTALASLTFRAPLDYHGPVLFNITLDDQGYSGYGGAKTNTYSVDITVNSVNDAPTLSAVTKPQVLEDVDVTFASADFTTAFTDVDNDALQSIQITSLPANGGLWLTGTPDEAIEVNDTLLAGDISRLYFRPDANWNGSTSFGWNASDGSAQASAAATVSLSVKAVNDAPSFDLMASPNQTVDEDSGAHSVANFALNIAKGPHTNENSQTVSFQVAQVSSDPAGLISVGPAISTDGTLTFTVAENKSGTATFNVTLTDNGGVADSGVNTSAAQSFTITVSGVNDLPTLNAIGDVTVDEDAVNQTINLAGITAGAGESQTLTVTAVSDDTDVVPNPTVNYTSPAATGSLTFSTVANAYGDAIITVTVSDGVDSFQRTFKITVNAVNDAPAFTPGSNITLIENDGQPKSYAGWATNITSGAANEPDPLTFELTAANTALFTAQPAVDATNGTLTFTPLSGANGVTTVTIRLSDGAVWTATSTFQINLGVNHSPITVNDTATTENDKAVTINVLANDSDEDGETLQIVAVSDPANGSTAIVGNQIVYTPDARYYGTDVFTYRVSDPRGILDNVSVEASVVVTVNYVINTSITPGQPSTIQFQDKDGLDTTITVPANSIPVNPNQSVSVVYTRISSSQVTPPPNLWFAGNSFEVTARITENGQTHEYEHFTFTQPLRMRLEYNEADLEGKDESSLKLYYWDDSVYLQEQWRDVASTCSPGSTYTRNSEENWIEVDVCHLTQFGMFADLQRDYQVFLPAIMTADYLSIFSSEK